MKKSIVILLVFIAFSSCSTNRQEKERLLKYNKALLTFSPIHVTHFPKDLTYLSNRKLYVYYPKSTRYNFKAGIILDCMADSTFFRKSFEALNRRTISNYSILSDSLFFVGDTIHDYSKIKNGIPVPSFIDIKDDFGLGGVRMNKSEHVYIFEAQMGEFLEKDELVNNLMLPENWKHGFSRGVVVDSIEYRLIYWLVLW